MELGIWEVGVKELMVIYELRVGGLWASMLGIKWIVIRVLLSKWLVES